MIKFVQKYIGDDQSSFSVQIESNDSQADSSSSSEATQDTPIQ